MDQNVPNDPYNNVEFDSFLISLKDDEPKYWYEIAQALGVSRKTIYRWKRHPKAQIIIKEEISEAMMAMKRSGRNDWRMWKERLGLLGVREERAGGQVKDQSISSQEDLSKLMIIRNGECKQCDFESKSGLQT